MIMNVASGTYLKLLRSPWPQPGWVRYHNPVSSQHPHHIGGNPSIDGHHRRTEVCNDFEFAMVGWEKLDSGCVAANATEGRKVIVENQDPRSEGTSDNRPADADGETVAGTVEDTPS